MWEVSLVSSALGVTHVSSHTNVWGRSYQASRAAPGRLLPLPKQLGWSPLQELAGGDGSVIVVGERRRKGEAAWGKGNVKNTPQMLLRPGQESTSQTLQICELWNTVMPTQGKPQVRFQSTASRLFGAFVEPCQGTLSSCAQHVPLVQASLVETSPLSCVISEWLSLGSLILLHAVQNRPWSRSLGAPHTEEHGPNTQCS